MGKKMKLPDIFKKDKARSLWKCWLFKHIKTISILINKANIFNNVKLITEVDPSVLPQPAAIGTGAVAKEPRELLEMAVEALRSNRLFFEPGNTNSILEAARFPFEDCLALAVETQDPYNDFRISMEDVVDACDLREKGHLEELLAWYLKMNRKKNHGFIVGAFIDVFTGTTSCCSASSVSVSDSSSRTIGGKS